MRLQLYILHLLRKSLNYVSWKMRKQVADDLKRIYQSATVDEAEQRLVEFEKPWNEAYRKYARLFTPPTPLSR